MAIIKCSCVRHMGLDKRLASDSTILHLPLSSASRYLLQVLLYNKMQGIFLSLRKIVDYLYFLKF